MELNVIKNVPIKIYRDIVKLDFSECKKASMVLRAVNHKLRQTILQTIEENERMTVTELYVKLRLDQSVASQHLAILRRARLVTTKREGKFIYYLLNYTRFEEINNFNKSLLYSK